MFENRLNPEKLDELVRGVLDKLPAGFQTMQQDMEKNLRIALQAALARMELVTRDEFDVQGAVLQRSREKLEALEIQVAALEKQLKLM